MKRQDAYNLLQKKYESALTQNAISAIQLSETLEEINAKTPSLRDQFAMAAITGLFANEEISPHSQHLDVVQEARTAYRIADAMLEARK